MFQTLLVFLPGKFHGWKSLIGYSPWGCKELDMTEQLHSLTCVSSSDLGAQKVKEKILLRSRKRFEVLYLSQSVKWRHYARKMK